MSFAGRVGGVPSSCISPRAAFMSVSVAPKTVFSIVSPPGMYAIARVC